MAIVVYTHDPTSEDRPVVGPLEEAIDALGDLVESKLKLLATAVGSYVVGYARSLAHLFVRVWAIVLRAWLITLPYFVVGALGEYLLGNFPFFTFPGVAGLFLLLGPVSFTALAFWLAKSTRPNDIEVTDSGIDKRMFAVPLTNKGYRFWAHGAVSVSIAAVIVIEVGWAFGAWPLVDMHRAWLLWPEVALLDRLVYLVEALFGGLA